MLNGRPVVFLSCSDRYKESVAAKVRAALDEVGVWGVIVSDEPLLPRVEWEPGAKVESYMNASDAVVALCTPDDTLADGTVRKASRNSLRRSREKPPIWTAARLAVVTVSVAPERLLWHRAAVCYGTSSV
jgi:hypothetical protein